MPCFFSASELGTAITRGWGQGECRQQVLRHSEIKVISSHVLITQCHDCSLQCHFPDEELEGEPAGSEHNGACKDSLPYHMLYLCIQLLQYTKCCTKITWQSKRLNKTSKNKFL